MNEKLLTRNEFRELVFIRDNHKCVNCKSPAVDAHHLLERRLWKDGGYYISNGVSVCENCHMLAEQTILPVSHLRFLAGITNIVVPPHLDESENYDKWGNLIFENGDRMRGELYYDESFQKIIKQANLGFYFVPYIKYPKTFHLPFSESIARDDKVIKNMDAFQNKRVIVTAKMDGENTSIYSDGYVHARSIDSRRHESRFWLKNFASDFAYNIPSGWRVCGENLYAKHSIHYKNLSSYFYGFSIWDNYNKCLGWDETIIYYSLLNIQNVPILYDGIYDEDKIKSLWNEKARDENEGYVVRVADAFKYKDFSTNVAKFVRKDHVQPNTNHWFTQAIVKNILVEDIKGE